MFLSVFLCYSAYSEFSFYLRFLRILSSSVFHNCWAILKTRNNKRTEEEFQMSMTHYMELLAASQPWNLIIYMVIPVALAEALVAMEFCAAL
jgi:hypothetical protein